LRVVDSCPVCLSHHCTLIAKLNAGSRRRFLEFSRRKYGGLMDDWADRIPPEVMQCEACAHYWYHYQPEPIELLAMYSAARSVAGRSLVPLREPTPRMIMKMRGLRRLFNDKVRPTFLDFGAGHGRWALAAARVGFAVTAYEPIVARMTKGESLYELVFDAEALRGRSFDAIQLEQVLEHVADPIQLLSEVRSLCHDQTVVRIGVPDTTRCPEGAALWESWPFDGRHPHTLAPFEHLHGFTPVSFQYLLRRAAMVSISEWELLLGWPKIAVANMLIKVGIDARQTGAIVRKCEHAVCA
jgi:SAM-dependent methyltransferase